MNFLSELALTLISGFGGAFVLLHFLGKSLINHQINKSLKVFDAQLGRKSEALKTELSIYAHEQNIALSRIDGQRAAAIHEIHTALRSWSNFSCTIANGSPHVNSDVHTHIAFYRSHAEQAHQSGFYLANALADNAIYFEADLYRQLAELSAKAQNTVATFLRTIRKGDAEGIQPTLLLKQIEEAQINFKKIHDEEIISFQQKITDQFRISLGTIRSFKN